MWLLCGNNVGMRVRGCRLQIHKEDYGMCSGSARGLISFYQLTPLTYVQTSARSFPPSCVEFPAASGASHMTAVDILSRSRSESIARHCWNLWKTALWAALNSLKRGGIKKKGSGFMVFVTGKVMNTMQLIRMRLQTHLPFNTDRIINKLYSS